MKEEWPHDHIGENFKMLKSLIVASSLAALGASMQAHADRVNLTCKAVLGGGHWNSLNGGYKFKDAGRDEFYVSFSQEPAFFQFEDRPDSSVFDRTSNLCGATYSGRTGSCQISSSKITFIQEPAARTVFAHIFIAHRVSGRLFPSLIQRVEIGLWHFAHAGWFFALRLTPYKAGGGSGEIAAHEGGQFVISAACDDGIDFFIGEKQGACGHRGIPGRYEQNPGAGDPQHNNKARSGPFCWGILLRH